MEALNQLLTERSDIWRGAKRPKPQAVSTGQPALDQWLPHHGWPCGQLIAFRPSHIGSGEFSILLPFLAKQTQQELPVLLISPPLIPCPQTLLQAGIDLKHLVVVRSINKQLWATEQALKSGLCGAIVVWPSSRLLSTVAMRRLQLACERGDAPVFLIAYKKVSGLSWPCALDLRIEPGPRIFCLEPESTRAPHHYSSLCLDARGDASCG